MCRRDENLQYSEFANVGEDIYEGYFFPFIFYNNGERPKIKQVIMILIDGSTFFLIPLNFPNIQK